MRFFWNYIYSPIAIIIIAIWTGICSTLAFLVSFLPYRKLHDAVIAMWAAVLLKILWTKVEVIGDTTRKEKGALLLFNHLSLMDIPLVYHALGADFRFGAKKELFRIPIFGHALKRLHFLPIERNNRSNTLRTYEKAKQRSQQGERFILAPEGTRQSQLQLGPFKSGPFILAIQANIPIQPIVLMGPEKLCPKHHLLPILHHKVILKVKVLEPVSTEGYTLENRNDLKDKVWTIMNKGLEELKDSP